MTTRDTLTLDVIIDGTLLTSLRGSNVDSTEIDAILSRLDGWEDADVSIETVPRLFGGGTYVKRISQGGMTVTVAAVIHDDSGVEPYHSALITATRAFSPVTLILHRGAIVTETVVGIIKRCDVPTFVSGSRGMKIGFVLESTQPTPL